ncbi:LemA family protein [Francisella uliginis]|uniref:LemA family protein n=1 Tax=Francisella uliginis TaxID=573570 RepID=A0A1L4BT49_9GAMM|nr:LemA family protein [Francisella uliginis]API87019.1 hypothetical protein F7310_06455 [Francisella uliginis]
MLELFILALFIVVIVSVIYLPIRLYNNIIINENNTKRAWSNTVVYQKQLLELIPRLEANLDSYKDYEKATLTDIVSLRESIKKTSSDEIDLDKLSKSCDQTEQLISKLNVRLEQYPDLKSNTVYLKFMDSLSDNYTNVTSSIRIFNSCVNAFNDSITMFPHSIINAIFLKKHKLDNFQHKKSEDSLGGFKPNF